MAALPEQPENPYAAPEPHQEEPRSETIVDERPRWRFYLTHIIHNGCNLLGLINVFGFIGGLFVFINAAQNLAESVRILALAVFLLLMTIADIAWRMRMTRGSLWHRLLSPSAGGCLAFLPVWSIYPATTVIGCICVVLQRRG